MEYIKLGTICSKIGSGSTPKGGASVYIDEGTSLIRSQNVYNLNFQYNGLAYITEEAAYKLRGVTIKKNDVLINITGDSVARTCIVPDDVIPARVNQHVAIIRPDENVINPYYLNYYLASPFMQATMLNFAVGKGASRNAMTKEMIEKFLIPCPTISIQSKIVDILKSYDKLIENNNKRIRLLEQMVENLYKEWFVRFRFPEYEDMEFDGTLPLGWQYQPISESMDFFDSQRVPLSSMQRDEMEKIYPYYGAAKLMDYVDDYLFDGEYLLLGEDGTVVNTDGFPVLQLVNEKFWVNNHAHVIRGKGHISTRFLYLTFCRFPITGVVTGSAQPKISKGRLEKLKILVPDAIRMEHFNNLINPMFDEINVLKKQVMRITKQRDMLLPRLMSGKLEV